MEVLGDGLFGNGLLLRSGEDPEDLYAERA
jgi:hypothetical protein